MAGLMDLAMLILTNEKSACLNQAGCINYLSCCSEELCDLTSDHISGTPNQMPSTDEIMPNVNHSGIYIHNTKKSADLMHEHLYLNCVVPECQITNKVNKEGDKRKHRSQKKSTQAN